MNETDTSTTVDTAEVRVARGLAWLRETGPSLGLDVNRVDPEAMALTDGERCVLAQAGAGSYGRARDKAIPAPDDRTDMAAWDAWVKYQDEWARDHGFLPLRESYGWHVQWDAPDADTLTAAWRAALSPAGV